MLRPPHQSQLWPDQLQMLQHIICTRAGQQTVLTGLSGRPT